MTVYSSLRPAAAWLVATCLGWGTVPATAAGLKVGEYACAGSGGRILIGLGFKLSANGTYTDLDGKNSGKVVYEGSNVRFIGGHLDGQVGRNVRGDGNFEINMISCSRS
jgi:hypothetical protein